MSDALADAFVAAWSGRDERRFAGVCATDVHYEDPTTSLPLSGLEAIGVHARRLWMAFPDVRVERIGATVAEAGRLVVPVGVRGTQTGRLGTLPASGRYVSLTALCYCELDADSRTLARVRSFFDSYAAAVALGLLPRPGSLRERALRMIQGYGVVGELGGRGLGT